MYAPRGSRRVVGQQLGAILPIVTGINQVASLLGLNSSDPVKDQERINRINLAFDLAMSGSTQVRSDLGGMTGAAYLQYIAADATHAGSQIAYRYAQAKWAEYRARHAAGVVGGGLISVSDVPATVVGTIQRAVTNPLVLGGVAVGAYLLLKKRGRRV